MMNNNYFYVKTKLLLIIALIISILYMNGCKKNASSIENNDSNPATQEQIDDFDDFIVSTKGKTDTEEFYAEVSELSEAAETFSDDEVLTALNANHLSDATKHILVELLPEINHGDGVTEQSSFEDLILNKHQDESTRIALINALDFSDSKSIEILESIVYTENSPITTNALRTIEKNSPQKALIISDDIIKRASQFGEYQIKIAVMVKSDYLRDMSISSSGKASEIDVNHFIDFCISQFNESSNSVFKDAMIFSLMDINNLKSDKAIIYHNDIDTELKRTCVIRNYQAFVTTINNNPSEENVNCIVEAMKIESIKELGILMEQKLYPMKDYHTPEFRSLIDNIKENGNSANKKALIEEPKFKWT